MTTATFELTEHYFTGHVHIPSTQADAELAQVVADVIDAGNVDVFGLTMTVLADDTSVVRWQVSVTIPTAQIGTLGARHTSPAFEASIGSNAKLLGGTHSHSLYRTSGGVDASAVAVLATAPPPPSPPI